MLQASCHCGAVKINITELPSTLTQCNCSICFRLGALWAYYTPDKIQFQSDPSISYLWDDQNIALHHCPNCGCATHYITTPKVEKKQVVINARMLPSTIADTVHIRQFDGADTWTYLNE